MQLKISWMGNSPSGPSPSNKSGLIGGACTSTRLCCQLCWTGRFEDPPRLLAASLLDIIPSIMGPGPGILAKLIRMAQAETVA